MTELKEENKTINLGEEEWKLILLGIYAKLAELQSLPEPLRTRESIPFEDIGQKIVQLLTPGKE